MEHRWGYRRRLILPVRLHGAGRPGRHELLRMRARVVRQGPGGVGVEREQFAAETLQQILLIATALQLPGIDATPGATAQTSANP